MRKYKSQPFRLIKIKNIAFSFLVDTDCKYNLLTPCFVDFFSEEYPPSYETIEFHARLNLNFPTQEAPIKTPLYLFEEVFQKRKGIKRIKCKDGINRGCESVICNFEYNGKAYSELFYIDQSLCSHCTSKEKMFSGILGTAFLKKHKWIIDFENLEIYNSK
ncbi:hypothetical protein [Odoribacter laneus]|uniref:Uncharacterized protein n=1 Tax=Odoribacter laneus YIT 12061 TaxID=742817 RepID=H1DD21_9BACT|nr:hypothetical protein [Odoribacter laneus]EHP51226.1 hypothetical protein HMPREF9449_00228 [Odoribacter laneus YIT 12061]